MTLAPNHHAHYPGFAGVPGAIAALKFTVGRTGDAEIAIRLAAVGHGDRVVDIGCGPGVAVRRAAAAGAASAVGIDPATVMLRVARVIDRVRRTTSMVRFLRGTAEAVPLPGASATVVWSLATVHHWRDLEAGLAEARRILRPSGRLLAIERKVEAGATGHASHGWTPDQAHAFAALLGTGGFGSIEVGEHRTRRRTVLSVLAVAT